ncbi:DNA-directed DNA polymerase alpha subunit pol12 [Irineochytrium annulatum]|nr:DNA-directed DNA polymerase alpha subunit pol12 [Irineochytrium annulatum]
MLRAGTTRDDLIREFGNSLGESKVADVLDGLLSIASIYSVPADTLFTKWERILINSKSGPAGAGTIVQHLADKSVREEDDGAVPTLAHLEMLRVALQTEHEDRVNEAIGLGKPGQSFLTRTKKEVAWVDPPDNADMFDDDSLQAFLAGEAPPPKTPMPRAKVRVRGDGHPPTPSQPPSSITRPSFMTPAAKRSTSTPRPSVNFSSSPAGPVPGSTLRTPMGPPGFTVKGSPLIPPTPAGPSLTFSARQNRGKCEEVLNKDVPMEPCAGPAKAKSGARMPTFAKRSVELPEGQQMEGYRYMWEKISVMADLVDERINEMAAVLLEHIRAVEAEDGDGDGGNAGEEAHQIEFGDPSIPQNEAFYTAGRICCDAMKDEKMNFASVVMESSRALGNGERVHLNFDDVFKRNECVALFPGQIIAVRGTNPSGKQILVQKVFLPPKLPPATTNISELVKYYPEPADGADDAAARPINVFVASGPYTLDDSMSYEPLEALAEAVESEKPDLVILMGPFVDVAHPMIGSGDCAMSCEEIHREVIAPLLRRILAARADNHLVLIPSTRDLCTEWVGYPQPPLASTIDKGQAAERMAEMGLNMGAGSEPRLRLLPNPVQFVVNEVMFAVSTADGLAHVGGRELAWRPKGSNVDRMSQLFGFFLDQRHLYPLSPPHVSETFTVDQTRLNSGAVTLQATPDVLIMPSLMRCSARSVDGCVCINPGQLCRGRSAGTFAKMCVHPLNVDGIREAWRGSKERMEVDGDVGEAEHALLNRVSERCRVEIVRI